MLLQERSPRRFSSAAVAVSDREVVIRINKWLGHFRGWH